MFLNVFVRTASMMLRIKLTLFFDLRLLPFLVHQLISQVSWYY